MSSSNRQTLNAPVASNSAQIVHRANRPRPSGSSSSSSFVHAVSLDWHHSPEGQGVLAHLTDQETGHRKCYGYLERPLLPPTVLVAPFKLYLCGRAGAGKTSLVSFLAGRPDWVCSGIGQQGETPGIRVTTLYWPTKIRQQLVLFQLALWDHGESAGKKYAHIQPVCRDSADAAVFVFSFSDLSGFDEVDAGLTGLSQAATRTGEDQVCPVVIGTRYGSTSDSEVSQKHVTAFETKWNRPVLKVRHQSQNSAATNPNEVAFVLNLICDQLWCHRQLTTATGGADVERQAYII